MSLRETDRSSETVVRDFDRLAHKLARRHVARYTDTDFADALQEARLALLEAHKTFDPARAEKTAFAGFVKLKMRSRLRDLGNREIRAVENTGTHGHRTHDSLMNGIADVQKVPVEPDELTLDERVQLALAPLTPDQRTVVELRYGLVNGVPCQGQCLATALNVSIERSRWLLETAMRAIHNVAA